MTPPAAPIAAPIAALAPDPSRVTHIVVDDRRGSAEPEILREFATYDHVAVRCERLHAGDFMFLGHGPEGICSFGFERKTWSDYIQSLEKGRLMAQAAALVGFEGTPPAYRFPFLVVEGVWKPDATGNMMIPGAGPGRWQYPPGLRTFPVEKLENSMMMLSIGCGLRVIRTASMRDTVAMLIRTARLVSKQWESHQTIRGYSTISFATHAEFVNPTAVRAVASVFPGVGWEKSRGFEDVFDTVSGFIEAAAAGAGRLQVVHGIGPRLAAGIHKAVVTPRMILKVRGGSGT